MSLPDIKAVVCDGKHHVLDSKDIAFFVAGKKDSWDADSRVVGVYRHG